MSAPTHTFTGPHPEVLADGAPVAVGAECSPDPSNPHDAAMIARGWFVPVEEVATNPDTTPEPEPVKRQRRTEPKPADDA